MFNKTSHLRTRFNLFLAALSMLVAIFANAQSASAEEKFFGDKYDTSFTQMTHYESGEPYNIDKLEPLVIKDKFAYIQPWDGYCNKSDRPEIDAVRLPCSTANVKPSLKYAGVEMIGNKWMKLACDEARKSVQTGGGPFATVIVQVDDDTNNVIRYWVSHNAVVMWCDPTAHGEVTAIRQACKELGALSLGLIRKDQPGLKLPQTCATSHCELYTSAEPCSMCYTATRWARISKIYFAATVYDAAAQGVNFSDEPIYNELSLNYSDRRKMGVSCYQMTLDNSLDAFNHYKRITAGKY